MFLTVTTSVWLDVLQSVRRRHDDAPAQYRVACALRRQVRAKRTSKRDVRYIYGDVVV